MPRHLYTKLLILFLCFATLGLSAQLWVSRTGSSTPREMDPVLRPDGGALFFTRPDFANNKGTDNAADIWITSRYDDGSWGRALNPGSPINTFAHDRALAFSPDGSRLAVLRTGGTNYIDLLETSGRNWRIIDSWPLPEGVAPRFDLTFDANAQYLIYSTYHNGHLDLYRRLALPNGQWASAEPLSPLNGPGNETGPSLSPDGRTLYFRRDGGRWFLQSSHGESPSPVGLSASIRQFSPSLTSREIVAAAIESSSTGERLQVLSVSADDLPLPVKLTRGYLPDALPPGTTTASVILNNGTSLTVRPDALRRYAVFLRQGEFLANVPGIDPLATNISRSSGSLAATGNVAGATVERQRLEAGIARRQRELDRLDTERRRYDLVAPKTEDPELAALRARYQSTITAPGDTIPPTKTTAKGSTSERRYAAELDELERMKAKFRKQQNEKLGQRSRNDHQWSQAPAPKTATTTSPRIGESYRPLTPADQQRAYQDSLRLAAEIRAGLTADKSPRAYQREPWENEVRQGLPRTTPLSEDEAAKLDENYQKQLAELEAMRAKLRRLDSAPPPATNRSQAPASTPPPSTWVAKGKTTTIQQRSPETYAAPRGYTTPYPPAPSTTTPTTYGQPRATTPGAIPAGISFIPNTAYPDGAGYTGLDQLVGLIQQSTSVVEIRVHTPKTLNRRAAQLLSEERATTIINFLNEQGVAPGNYRVIGFGNNLTGLGGERVEVIR